MAIEPRLPPVGLPCYGRAVLVQVAVAAPLRQLFTYRTEDPEALTPGRRLLVPFGRRRVVGISLGPTEEAPPGTIRKVEKVLDDRPVFSPDLLALLRFASDYYLYPLGEAMKTALPPDYGKADPPDRQATPRVESVSLRVPADEALPSLGRAPSQAAVIQHLAARGGSATMEELRLAVGNASALLRSLESKGFVELHRSGESSADDSFAAPLPPPLSPGQQAALDAIVAALGGFQPFLLLGVTGSGKTEVYLRAIAEVRERGQGALVLVPEIALTPQLAGRFRSRFGDDVAVLHSGQSARERSAAYRRLLEGDARIAVGARSAVFAPVQDLGIVVVDEEHEPSFKQEEKLRYHARDLAVLRAKLLDIPCVLGSATPSLESFENVRRERYRLLELPERIDSRPLPEVRLVDLSGRPPELREDLLSDELSEALEQTLADGKQAIFFLNRRGHASLVLCPSCGDSARCPNCDVALTQHLARKELRCHYCDHRIPEQPICATCGSDVLALGVGTERVERELERRFPDARVLRLDRDTVRSPAELSRILAAFAKGEADVLVGTQMIAKGHDFPGVTLVGVILADIGLLVPDFRAAERTFQLLTQVAGRAGRGADAGQVLIQTFHPDAEPITLACRHDYWRFAERELEKRREQGFPPTQRMLAVRIEAEDPAEAERVAHRLAQYARRKAPPQTKILGPAPPPIPRLRGKSRFQLVALAPDPGRVRALGQALLELSDSLGPRVKVALDVDPISLF